MTYLENSSRAEIMNHQPRLAGIGPIMSIDSVCQGEAVEMKLGGKE